jgi:hypothetical protein
MSITRSLNANKLGKTIHPSLDSLDYVPALSWNHYQIHVCGLPGRKPAWARARAPGPAQVGVVRNGSDNMET